MGKVVELLLAARADVESASDMGSTPLFAAAAAGDARCIALLLRSALIVS